MKQSDEHFDAAQPVDSRTIMRLVDDELTDKERVDVLRSLEIHSEGWRACALAFLEDQTLRREFAHTREQRVPPARVNESGRTISARPAKSGNEASSWQSLLAVAATILIAFGVGWFGSQNRKGFTPTPEAVVQQQPRIAGGQPWPAGATDSQPNMVVAGTYSVPDRSFWEQESVIPQEVRRELQAKGTEVRRQRGLMPYWLPDGRRITVPYEDVQLVPVNQVSY